MTDRLLALLSAYSPNFRRALVDCVLFTPWDLENQVLLTDGNIHHVDITPSQMLWQRPLPELARYRTPLAHLYLCGAGQHPYGEVSGGPGHNAAHAVLEDLGAIAPGSWEHDALSA
jgi:phytoene dehydrogenase-like protein